MSVCVSLCATYTLATCFLVIWPIRTLGKNSKNVHSRHREKMCTWTLKQLSHQVFCRQLFNRLTRLLTGPHFDQSVYIFLFTSLLLLYFVCPVCFCWTFFLLGLSLPLPLSLSSRKSIAQLCIYISTECNTYSGSFLRHF